VRGRDILLKLLRRACWEPSVMKARRLPQCFPTFQRRVKSDPDKASGIANYRVGSQATGSGTRNYLSGIASYAIVLRSGIASYRDWDRKLR
jgi:hypothetical protein